MTSQPQGLLFGKEQFCMRKLQVFNWGTFSGIHDVPISERGFLFVGKSGTGKSTLLDAFSAMLVPARWIDFNAAARETDRSGRDRNFVSYIRGAWAEQKDGESGEFVMRYLRPGTTWSALALSYRSGIGQSITLVQVLWVRGSANSNADVKHHYLVFEREFDLNELADFGHSDLDVRKLKQSFPDTFSRDEFRPYCEHFCRLLGIESEMALKLLHKTQSAKNLGDLNIFLRDFMLDKPQTFDVADTLVNEFGELNAAHQSVVTARRQIETLAPAREKHQQMESFALQRTSLKELQSSINIYRDTQRMVLLKERLDELAVDAEGLNGEIAQRHGLLENSKNVLSNLEQRHREIGGDRIEEWENEKRSLQERRAERLRKRDQAASACGDLGWALGDTPQAFAELIGKARQEIERIQNGSGAMQEERLAWAEKRKEAETAFASAIKEVQALQSQPSNIPATMLDLRNTIAQVIGVSVAALPFAGELIEVKADESLWQGAIERVLRSFALSILVDDQNYSALSKYINDTHLGQRLVYYRTGRVAQGLALREKPVDAGSLVFKLNIKEGNYADWLKAELRQRFDYACVESVQAFRSSDRALTREGQVKHSKTRHEKDDRRKVNDKHNWVLGFNNREKLALFQREAQELALVIEDCKKELNALTDNDNENMVRALRCKTLEDLQWQEIDVAPLLARISAIEKSIYEVREGNTDLSELAKKIAEQQSLITQAEEELHEKKSDYKTTREKIEKDKADLTELQNDPSIVPLTPHQKTGLDERFRRISSQHGGNIRLDNIDRVTTSVVEALGKEMEDVNRNIAACEKHIESVFADFKRTWPMECGDVDSTLSSAPDFFAKLARLETDGLPKHEQRFFELLQTQSNQNLAALSQHLNNSRKAIQEGMERVNESLRKVPFNKTLDQCTYLNIVASDRQLPDVQEFKQKIKEVLNYAWNDEREHTEARFHALSKLVQRLSSQENEGKRWRELVLDVRQHVEFIGREIDEDNIEVEIYRSGAGKSGGQRQKLATTCLAAALRYQLGGNEHGVPMYAPVILDEAFDKADNDFTALSMNIFNNFGFQMIVATPLRSVMTLEPFIGGACFVDISDRRISSVFNIEYDNESRRLNLPAQAQEGVGEEADIETSP